MKKFFNQLKYIKELEKENKRLKGELYSEVMLNLDCQGRLGKESRKRMELEQELENRKIEVILKLKED